jgi:hypothetical protein
MSRWLACSVVLAVCLEPLACRAQDDSTTTAFSYAAEGLGTGIALGLATGYLLSRPTWESSDWATLGVGAGIGALGGLGLGITLGMLDVGGQSRVHVGGIILKDINLGIATGLVAGAIVGTIVWIGGGKPADVLIGLSWGVIFGAGAGLLLGIVESVMRKNSAHAEAAKPGFAFNIGFTGGPGAIPLPAPMLTGRF